VLHAVLLQALEQAGASALAGQDGSGGGGGGSGSGSGSGSQGLTPAEQHATVEGMLADPEYQLGLVNACVEVRLESECCQQCHYSAGMHCCAPQCLHGKSQR
jgi:hypothetical protein